MISYYLSDCCAQASSGHAFKGLDKWAYHNERGESKTGAFKFCPFCGKTLPALGDPPEGKVKP